MSELIDLLLADARERMDKSVESIRHKFGTVRTGRASPALLDRIMVDYYGAQTPLKQLATIASPEARLLTVQAYDKSSVKSIEKAIMESDVGLTPNSDGALIRLAIPELTEERRKELVKQVKKLGEEHKVGVRNARRDAIAMVKEFQKDGDLAEDDARHLTDKVQKLTDDYTAQIDKAVETKEAELMKV